MLNAHRSLVLFAATALLAGASSLTAQVLTVGPQPGADHADIQAAIDAATTGGVILVTPGTYPGFDVDGSVHTASALHIVSDSQASQGVVIDGRVTVQGLAAEQRLSLIGLRIEAPLLTTDPYLLGDEPPALALDACAGSIRLERLSVIAASMPFDTGACDFDLGYAWPDAAAALDIHACDDVVLQTVTAMGGHGVDDGNAWSTMTLQELEYCINTGSTGGPALSARDSRVHLHNVIATGGLGANHALGGRGGTGVELLGTTELFVSGLVSDGGIYGWSHDYPISGFNSGGDGVVVGPQAQMTKLGGVFNGGLGQPDGVPLVQQGTYATLPGEAHRFVTPGPAREGGALTLTLNGDAGDLAWFWVGFDEVLVNKPSFGGALYIGLPFAIGPKLLPPLSGGTQSFLVPVPELGPGIDAFVVDMQVYVLENDGDKVLTAPAAAVLLDGGV